VGGLNSKEADDSFLVCCSKRVVRASSKKKKQPGVVCVTNQRARFKVSGNAG
jgi:hypothetical protein